MKTRILATILLLFFTTAAQAQVKTFEEGRSVKGVSSKTLIPKLASGQAYSERYTFSALLSDGSDFYLEMTISNFGWGDHSAATATRLELAGHSPYADKQTMDKDEWSFNKSKFQMTMGRSSVEVVKEGEYRVRHRGDVEYDLIFKNILPSWRPGSGEIRADGDYFRLGLIAPRASVTGRVKIDGKWVDVTSRQGMADWSVTTIAPFDLAKQFGRFRATRGDTYVAWRSIKLSEDLGGEEVVWVMVGKGNKIIFEDASATIEKRAIKKDKKSGYNVPYEVIIRGSDGGQVLELTLENPGRYQVSDLLDSYGSVTRFLAQRFTKPFQFNANVKWRLNIKGDSPLELNGRGPFGMDILN